MIFYYTHPASLYINKFRVAGLLKDPVCSSSAGRETDHRGVVRIPLRRSLLVPCTCHGTGMPGCMLTVGRCRPCPQVNPFFESLFETGVDEMSWDDLSKNEMQWPSIRECTEYRRGGVPAAAPAPRRARAASPTQGKQNLPGRAHLPSSAPARRRTVYQLVKNVIETCPGLDGPVGPESPCWAVFMGFEHERIHLETSSVLIREMPARLLVRPKWWPADHALFTASHPAPQNDLVEIPAGDVVLGKPHDWPSFGWDNEYGARGFHVRQFRASRFLISNAEFLEFVREGGYQSQQHWTEQGWKWRTFRNAKWPCFWVLDGPSGLHQYKLRTVFEVVDMVPSAPAVVNHHEAKAYCNWLSAKQGLTGDAAFRLMTEPEHHRLRETAKVDGQGRQADDAVMYKSGRDFAGQLNLNLAYGSETPVDALTPTKAGIYDPMGNVWTWCEDFFSALPGFTISLLYTDFSTPCFDGEHNIIMNGSFIATGDEASVFSRFHFR